MRSVTRTRLVVAFILLCTALSASARDFDLTGGKHEVLPSKVLNEDRDLLIAAPQKPVPNMPLLVVLDGEWNFRKVAVAMENLTANNLMPPTVVVGAAIGQAEPPVHSEPGHYLSEAQRRRHAWTRRFGSAFETQLLPLLSVARPLLDALATPSGRSLASTWQMLQLEYKDDFRFDPIERGNLIAALEARGKKNDPARLRELPGFNDGLDAAGLVPNDYGDDVHLDAGLVANLPLAGQPADLCHPDSKTKIHGAVPAPDRHDKADGVWRFSGNGDFIEFPANSDYSNAGSLTVSAWVRSHEPASWTAWVSQVSSLGWARNFGWDSPSTQRHNGALPSSTALERLPHQRRRPSRG